MKNQEKHPKKQDTGDKLATKKVTNKKVDNSHESNDPEKGPWKDPDPTDPRRSTEKINKPYASNYSSPQGQTKSQPTAGIKKEKVTNAGESEHHSPVNKKDYDDYEGGYNDANRSHYENEDFE